MIEEHRIRERAHGIWESEGRPSGRAEAHWSLASAQLATETRPAKPAARKAPAAKAAAATTPRKSRKSPPTA